MGSRRWARRRRTATPGPSLTAHLPYLTYVPSLLVLSVHHVGTCVHIQYMTCCVRLGMQPSPRSDNRKTASQSATWTSARLRGNSIRTDRPKTPEQVRKEEEKANARKEGRNLHPTTTTTTTSSSSSSSVSLHMPAIAAKQPEMRAGQDRAVRPSAGNRETSFFSTTAQPSTEPARQARRQTDR
ncbi:hypothetical protein B0T24DRAFT_47543 [Lasiosphaeria ovina]|uniref:Uncharacterized protein n=1 Tax=Lasiosphaeria ovina TaxID=92902 RepID=A0AAE0NL27_9PEZI|nr:hypothetical protein B0T24DRAFT_47543 [Lasiosphaeria ovina]